MKYNPPTLALEYSTADSGPDAPNDVLVCDLGTLTAETSAEDVISALTSQHEKYFNENVVSMPQLLRLAQNLVANVTDGGAAASVSQARPIHRHGGLDALETGSRHTAPQFRFPAICAPSPAVALRDSNALLTRCVPLAVVQPQRAPHALPPVSSPHSPHRPGGLAPLSGSPGTMRSPRGATTGGGDAAASASPKSPAAERSPAAAAAQEPAAAEGQGSPAAAVSPPATYVAALASPAAAKSASLSESDSIEEEFEDGFDSIEESGDLDTGAQSTSGEDFF